MRLQRRSTLEAPGPLPPPGEGDDPGAPAPRGRAGRRYDPAWNDWNPPRRWPGVLLSAVIVLGFLSAVVWHLRPHSVVHHPKVVLPTNTNLKPSFMPSAKGARAASFAGTRSENGLRFMSNGGLLIMHAQCTCQYNFIVTISNASLAPIAFPVNDTGRVNDVLDTTVPKGPLVVKVVGAGHWFVQLVQPLATTPVIHTPFKYFSAGNDILGPFSSANTHLSFKFLSLSNGGAVVHVLNLQGFGVQTPFKGLVAIKSVKNLASLPHPYFLEVEATGFWQLVVQRAP